MFLISLLTLDKWSVTQVISFVSLIVAGKFVKSSVSSALLVTQSVKVVGKAAIKSLTIPSRASKSANFPDDAFCKTRVISSKICLLKSAS
jgi:hypothetical protein